MKLITKQNEVRLVAETDVDKYYLDNFFGEAIPMYVTKSYSAIDDDECVTVTLSSEKQEHNEPN